MIKAYVLIQTEIGEAPSVASEVRAVEAVTLAVVLAGPYDVLASVAAEDVDSLGKLAVSGIQAVPGVTRTLTCPVVHL
ncbi:MAG: Lrp/AsnC family transcriptional regulator [bacterium]|nr:Lrp/AsnC family transcriptional regulator [bacterium]MCP4966099.1 Lrp/AsnC family transcriptional regulator [bacterium]